MEGFEPLERPQLVFPHETTVTDHIDGEYGGETAFHPRSPFPERLAQHKGKIYSPGTGSNVRFWL